MGFKRLDPDDFVVSAQSITSTCWSGNATALTTFFTQSNQVASISGKYYTNVFNADSGSADRASQFQIAYGNSSGGGALAYNNTAAPGVSPTSTIYGQYRTLMLEDENSSFIFGNFTGSSIYVLSVERARYKEALLPGSLNLTVGKASKTIQLTDNSKDVTLPTYYGTQRAYQIVSGSDGAAWSGNGYSYSGSYGLFFPDTATIILNGAALDDNSSAGSTGTNDGEGINLSTNTTANTNGNNNQKMFNAIVSGSNFALNSEETITSDFVFVRARNSEFNYSENPSYISGSTGEVIYNYFINNPQTYMTTVGLYNDSNDLLAVAKLSKPLNKDFTKEALIRVKLDF
jgi:hypothetical protein|tara:strand:+ start:3149 stop:4183 length:1035 start_codon:yes stop_codon:yes gene_type:complete